ncbi:flagellar hook-length control protein FliK [Microbacterium sp. NPDC056234]|uniref:flagellar hook-length control protein FliK n=1 Tax=Microbacterium sp. NPDC056234 TaxID=3345757 RepID=UPI0035D5BAE6
MTMLGLLTGVAAPSSAGAPAGPTAGMRAGAFAEALRQTLAEGTGPTATPPCDPPASPNGVGISDDATDESDPLTGRPAIADHPDAAVLSPAPALVGRVTEPPVDNPSTGSLPTAEQALPAEAPSEQSSSTRTASIAAIDAAVAERGAGTTTPTPMPTLMPTPAPTPTPTGAASADGASRLAAAGVPAAESVAPVRSDAATTTIAGVRGAATAASVAAPIAAPSAAVDVPASDLPDPAPAPASVEAPPANPNAGIPPASASEPPRPPFSASEHATVPRPVTADLSTTSVTHAAPAATVEPVGPALAPVSASAVTGQLRAALHPQVSAPIISLARAPEGEHTITLTVSPENLGPVTIRAHLAAGAVHMELVSATDAGREALRSILTDLRRDLAAAMPSSSLSLAGQDGATSSGSTGQNAGAGAQGTGTPGGRGASPAQAELTDGIATAQDAIPTPFHTASPDGGIDVYA